MNLFFIFWMLKDLKYDDYSFSFKWYWTDLIWIILIIAFYAGWFSFIWYLGKH